MIYKGFWRAWISVNQRFRGHKSDHCLNLSLINHDTLNRTVDSNSREWKLDCIKFSPPKFWNHYLSTDLGECHFIIDYLYLVFAHLLNAQPSISQTGLVIGSAYINQQIDLRLPPRSLRHREFDKSAWRLGWSFHHASPQWWQFATA